MPFLELFDKPPVQLAAFFHGLIVAESQVFGMWAENACEKDISEILIEFLRHEPESFLKAMAQLNHARIGKVMEEIKRTYFLDFYSLVLKSLLCPFGVDNYSKIILNLFPPDMRYSIAIASVAFPNYAHSAISLFDDTKDLKGIFNERLRISLNMHLRNSCLAKCLCKLLPYCLEEHQTDLFYKAGSEAFVLAIKHISKSSTYTKEMRSQLLNALNWDKMYGMGQEKVEFEVQIVAALASLAGSQAELNTVLAWYAEKHYDPLDFPIFLAECAQYRLNNLLAYLILPLTEEGWMLIPIDEDLISILHCISNVSDEILLPLVNNCSPGLIDYFLANKLPLIATFEDEDGSVINISMFELLKTLEEDPLHPLSFFLKRIPRILLILAMRHSETLKPLASCYRLLSASTMRRIEPYIPEVMLQSPVMLPFVRDIRSSMLEKMEPREFQSIRDTTKLIAVQALGRIEQARKELEEELKLEQPDRKKLISQTDNYLRALNEEGDFDPGMRLVLCRKRERHEIDDADAALLSIFEKVITYKQGQLSPNEPVVIAKKLIHAEDPTVDCLSEYIFNMIPKEDFALLNQVGIQSDSDLRILGIDPDTQAVIEEYREQLAAGIHDAKIRHEVLALWRTLHLLPMEGRIAKVKLIANALRQPGNPPLPKCHSGMSLLIPSCQWIEKGSWESAVLWVVNAFAPKLWNKYKSQNNLVQVWEKLEGKTLCTLGITDPEALLDLNSLQSKRHKGSLE